MAFIRWEYPGSPYNNHHVLHVTYQVFKRDMERWVEQQIDYIAWMLDWQSYRVEWVEHSCYVWVNNLIVLRVWYVKKGRNDGRQYL